VSGSLVTVLPEDRNKLYEYLLRKNNHASAYEVAKNFLEDWTEQSKNGLEGENFKEELESGFDIFRSVCNALMWVIRSFDDIIIRGSVKYGGKGGYYERSMIPAKMDTSLPDTIKASETFRLVFRENNSPMENDGNLVNEKFQDQNFVGSKVEKTELEMDMTFDGELLHTLACTYFVSINMLDSVLIGLPTTAMPDFLSGLEVRIILCYLFECHIIISCFNRINMFLATTLRLASFFLKSCLTQGAHLYYLWNCLLMCGGTVFGVIMLSEGNL
jgi:hypothetical protein